MTEMTAATLYGVGVGPGDPDLMTLAAINTIKRCPVIALPDSGEGRPVVLEIAREHIGQQEIVLLDMPMSRDQALLEQKHREAAARVTEYLELGKDVAFLTLGDPSIYATYLYLHRIVRDQGFPVRLIPGVPSFCAAAASLNEGLCEGAEALHIIPASYPGTRESLSLDGTLVLMKSGKKAREVLQWLGEEGRLEQTSLVERCGMPDERIVSPVTGTETSTYFTTMIVKG